MKNFNADMTNPNIYEAVKDHVYDEIKHKEGYQPGELLLLKFFAKKNILQNLYMKAIKQDIFFDVIICIEQRKFTYFSIYLYLFINCLPIKVETIV